MLSKLCHEGKVSIYSFVAGLSLLIPLAFSDLRVLFDLGSPLITDDFTVRLLFLTLYYILLNVILKLKLTGLDYQVSFIAVDGLRELVNFSLFLF